MVLQAATLCNDATIKYSEGKYKRIGEPTEAALKVLVEKIGIPNKVGCASNRVHALGSFRYVTVLWLDFCLGFARSCCNICTSSCCSAGA